MSTERKKSVRCPCCCSESCSPAAEKIKDWFYSSAGEFAFVRCNDCGSWYQQSVLSGKRLQRAYDTYYTHESWPKHPEKVSRLWSKIIYLRIAQLNGQLATTAGLGLLKGFVNIFSGAADISLRRLPQCYLAGSDVLDDGFGDGEFLNRASELGCNTYGIEYDDKAKKGAFNFLGKDVSALKNYADFFHYVSIHHVLEHVGDPCVVLSELAKSIRPKRFLWIEVPVSTGVGYSFFEKYWRGLEAPRHIWIPSLAGLTNMLHREGFELVYMGRKPVLELKMGIESALAMTRNGVSFWIVARSLSFFFARKVGGIFASKFYQPDIISVLCKKI